MDNKKKKNRSPFRTIEGYDDFLKKVSNYENLSGSTDDQTVTNCDQLVTISDQTVTNCDQLVTAGDQIVTKKLPNCDQTVTVCDNKIQSKNSDHNITNCCQDEFYKLSESMKKILFYIINSCENRNSLFTHPLQYQKISLDLGLSHSNTRQCFVRLTKKGLIKIILSKTGKGGHCVAEIDEKIKYHSIKFFSSIGWSSDQSVTKLLPISDQLVTNSPVVSSSYINTTTTIPNRFSSIDYSSLAETGFNESHLIQLYREYEKKPNLALDVNIVQDSINALSFDLKHNKVADDFKHSPVVVLISLLKKGIPYASKTPEKFKTPQQEAMDAYLTMKEQQHKLEKETEKRTFELEFEAWQSSLTEEKLLELCPAEEVPVGTTDRFYKTVRRRMAKEKARDYFEAEIWPAKKQDILNMR